MAEFNQDGSIKLPESYRKVILENQDKMKNQRCIKIEKIIVNDFSPKKCMLKITLSDKIADNRFVDTIYGYFRSKADVATKLSKVNEKEFTVEIGTCFRRCSDCSSLIRQLGEFLDGNLIEIKGNCSFEQNRNNFSYEDYFE